MFRIYQYPPSELQKTVTEYSKQKVKYVQINLYIVKILKNNRIENFKCKKLPLLYHFYSILVQIS